MGTTFDVMWCRRQFPGLARRVAGQPAVFFDGPAGSQVPQSSLPTTDVVNLEDGERFSWEFPGLIPNRDIQINLPKRLSYAQRVAQLQSDFRTIGNLAPILIGFFMR